MNLRIIGLFLLAFAASVQAQSTCTITGTIRNPDRSVAAGVRVSVTKVAPESGTGELYTTNRLSADTNASGVFTLSVPCNSIVTLQAPVQGLTNGQALAVGASGGNISSLVRVPSPSTVPIVIGGGGGGGGISDGDKGDITVSSSGATWAIDSGVVTSAKIADGAIVNADINSSAAIAYSKLALTGAILNTDLAGSIAISKLSITGTPNGAKFLRDDGSWQTITGGGDLLAANNLSDIASASTARTNLGLAIGTNVQAFDADLTTYAGITPSANVQTLLGSANYAAFRSSLGLATVATSGAYSDLSGRPTLGTSSALNVAASGNAASGEVVKGDDTRLSDARTPTAHNQAWSTITSTPTTRSGYGITDAAGNGAVTASGLTMATARLLGRSTASTGAIEEITVGSGLTLSGGTLSASGGGGGSPGGSDKQIQINNAGSFGGASGFEYQSGASPNVTITAQNAAHTGLLLKMAASQSVNPFVVQNSAGTNLIAIASNGALRLLPGGSQSDIEADSNGINFNVIGAGVMYQFQYTGMRINTGYGGLAGALYITSGSASQVGLRVDTKASPSAAIAAFYNSTAEYTRIGHTASAGNTNFWLYSGDSNSLKQVEVGATDSCGTGYRCLRITN